MDYFLIWKIALNVRNSADWLWAPKLLIKSLLITRFYRNRLFIKLIKAKISMRTILNLTYFIFWSRRRLTIDSVCLHNLKNLKYLLDIYRTYVFYKIIVLQYRWWVYSFKTFFESIDLKFPCMYIILTQYENKVHQQQIRE